MKNKVKIILILLILIIALLTFILLTNKISLDKEHIEGTRGNETNQNLSSSYCSKDSDCVPSPVCHPDSCIPLSEVKPNNMFCTQECKPNTLDCGQGSCFCVNNKCKAILGEN